MTTVRFGAVLMAGLVLAAAAARAQPRRPSSTRASG